MNDQQSPLNEPGLSGARSPITDAQRWQARWLVVIASLFWSTSGFFVKAPTFQGWPGVTLAAWRAIFATLTLLPMIRHPRWSWRLVPMMGCFAAMSFTYLTSMERMSSAQAGAALWLQATAPVWVLLVGMLFLKETIHPRDFVLIGFSFLGVLIMIAYRTQGAPLDAILLGLVSGLLYAGIVITLRMLRDFDSAWLVWLNQCATAVALAPAAYHQGPWPSGSQWLLLAAFGALQIGVPYLLFSRALRSLPGHEASAISLFEPILLPLWIFLAWGVAPDGVTFVAGLIILTGLVLHFWLSTGNETRPVAEEESSSHHASS